MIPQSPAPWLSDLHSTAQLLGLIFLAIPKAKAYAIQYPRRHTHRSHCLEVYPSNNFHNHSGLMNRRNPVMPACHKADDDPGNTITARAPGSASRLGEGSESAFFLSPHAPGFAAMPSTCFGKCQDTRRLSAEDA